MKRGEGQDPVGGVSASVMGSWVHRGTGGGTWGILYRVQGKRYTGYRVQGTRYTGTGVVHGYLVEDVRGTAINLSPGLFINCCPRLRLLICKTTHPLPPSYSAQSDAQCCNRVDV